MYVQFFFPKLQPISWSIVLWGSRIRNIYITTNSDLHTNQCLCISFIGMHQNKLNFRGYYNFRKERITQLELALRVILWIWHEVDKLPYIVPLPSDLSTCNEQPTIVAHYHCCHYHNANWALHHSRNCRLHRSKLVLVNRNKTKFGLLDLLWTSKNNR